MNNQTITAIPGIKVGNMTDLEAATGCTVILCPQGTVGSVDVRGGAPGTRETDLLQPQNRVEVVNAIVLSGGSAFGLATADGVMKYLAEREIGYRTRTGLIVPIVPATILFDLHIGSADTYPDAAMGYQAAENATNAPVPQGNVGAGTGAICGAVHGLSRATKGGLGSSCVNLGDGLYVGALVAVNAVGDILGENGEIIAGLRTEDGHGFSGMMHAIRAMAHTGEDGESGGTNTVIGAIATNARLSKTQVNKVAQMAHDGIARAINPAHTMFDGDTIFAVATGEIPSNATSIGAVAAEAMSAAIRNAVRSASTLAGVTGLAG